MGIDVSRARAETPGCGEVLHFNNAGAALMPASVVEAQIDHIRLESHIGGYEAAARAADRIESTYDAVAQLVRCDRSEVAVVENATAAWDQAFYAVPLRPGDRILTSRAEYASNFIAYLQRARRTGARVEVVPNDEHGQLSVAALEDMVDDRVALIALTHVPTNGGLVNPAEEVGRIAGEVGALYLLDACQSVGQLRIDVGAIGCHMLSATSRKYLRGPRGCGFLYVDRGTLDRLEPPVLDMVGATWTGPDRYELRDDARRFENWESNLAAKIGMGVAVEHCLSWGIDAIESRVTSLGERLRSGLNEVPGVTVHDRGRRRCGIVTFTCDWMGPPEIAAALAERAINVSVSPRSSTLLDMSDRDLDEVVRASVHYYNTDSEIERFCTELASLRL